MAKITKPKDALFVMAQMANAYPIKAHLSRANLLKGIERGGGD